MINGDVHAGGRRTPLDPRRTIAAVHAAATATDEQLVELLGPPAFATGCDVDVDILTWASGAATEVTATARIALENSRLVVSHLPPGSTTGEVGEAIHEGLHRLPGGRQIRDVADQWSKGHVHLVVELMPDADVDAVHRFLVDLQGVRRTWMAQMGAPVAGLVRAFDDPDRGALDARLALVEQAIT